MITVLGIIFLISGLFEIFIPLGFGFYLIRQFKTSWKVFFIGCLMFVASLVRIPLNQYVSLRLISANPQGLAWMLIVFSSMTAGIFEEGARYIAYKFLLQDHRVGNGLTYGVGHGGMESILIVGINVVTIGFILLMNPYMLPSDQLTVIEALPVYMPLVGLYERLMAIIIQIGLSFMVLESFRIHETKFFLMAISIHFLIDYLAASTVKYGVIYPELIATIFAVGLGFWVLYKLRNASASALY